METKEITKMRITEEAFCDIVTHIGGRPAETGGALFANETGVIQKFIYDRNAKVTGVTYTIDHQFINLEMKRLRAENLYLCGILHSHPGSFSELSTPDRQYFHELLTTKLKRDFFFAPIVHACQDGFKLFPYILDSKGNVMTKGQIEIVYNDEIGRDKSNTADIKIPIEDLLHKALAFQLFILKMLIILWAYWIIARLFLLVPQYILNLITYGTH